MLDKRDIQNEQSSGLPGPELDRDPKGHGVTENIEALIFKTRLLAAGDITQFLFHS